MEFPREQSIDIKSLPKALQFQVTSWYTCDCEYEGGSDESSCSSSGGYDYDESKYLVKVFGVTAQGASVSANILNFTPYFFIKIPHRIERVFIERIREFVISRLQMKLRHSLVNVKYMKRKDFWGFHNNETFSFIRFAFNSLKGFRAGIKIFSQRGISIPGFPKCQYQLYESNIEPFLRLIHLRDIEPAGWVQMTNFEKNTHVLPTKCQIDINVDWRKISKCDVQKMAPMVVASFDIECVSSHGDFPVARKDYKKVAYEFFQLHEAKKGKIDDLKEYLLLQLLGIFDNTFQGEMSKVFIKTPMSPQTFATLKTRTNKMIDDIVNVAAGRISYSSDDPLSKDDIMRKLTEIFGYYQEFEDKYTKKKTYSWKGLFPPIEGDEIIQIGTTVHSYGDKECSYKHIITLGSCDPIENVVVESCETESELLVRWCQLIDKLDPDILTGYNIFGFDLSYMHDRAMELNITTQFCKIGRISDFESKFQEKVLSSSALGDNILKYLDMEGRVLIDMMKVIQRDHKLDSYKLDNVANHFMGMNKHDVSPNDIFRFQRGTSADRKQIADYCVQDCSLCNHLMMKLETLANNIGMANVCNVPLSYIFMRGQGIKIFSLVAKQCKEDEYLIPTLNNGKVGGFDEDTPEDEEGYEGAIVLEPKTGIYTEDPVSVLDYASLYPSSMISENLSHDCLVERDGPYDNLPGIEYLDVHYDIHEKVLDKKTKVGEKICRFAQNEKGIIPRILMKLIRQRKETRKKIEYKTVTTINGDELIGLYSEDKQLIVLKTVEGKETSCLKSEVTSIKDTFDTFTKAVLDGLQLAYKITANSLYGQVGAKTSQIYLKDIAACTTATGRNMILKAKRFIEENYIGANIVYGDSVTGDTPLLLKFPDGHIDLTRIDSLTKDWTSYNNFKPFDEGRYGKEQSLTDAQIWTDQGWAEIRRVIRHKTVKKIYTVTTFQGSVDVTEDHSLVDIHMNNVKPSDCVVGETEILHSFPELVSFANTQSCCITKEEAWVWGLFFVSGSCGEDQSWRINNPKISVLNQAKDYLEGCEPAFMKFQVLQTLNPSDSSGLECCSNNHKYMVDKYRSLYYDEHHLKKIPTIILNASYEIRMWFLKGCLAEDNCKASILKNEFEFICKGKIGAQGLYYVVRSLGYKNITINTQPEIINTFWIRTTNQNECFDTQKNKVIMTYQSAVSNLEEFVYDIETDVGRFQGGVGGIICKNTDSIFTTFPNYKIDENGVRRKLSGKEAIEHAIQIGKDCSKKFKAFLKPPHDLEMEKVFYPFILISKKRYCAIKYETPDKGKFDSMGIVLKRRDNAQIAKIIYGGVIDIIMKTHDLQESIDFLKDCLQKLIDGNYPLEDLIITKSLRADYKDPTRIAHKALADRMGERDPGNKPQVNDRIPYVYIDISEKEKSNKTAKKDKRVATKILQGDRIEHPDYIRKNNLKPDYEFYITNQIMKPVSQIYALVLENMPGYKKGRHYFVNMEKTLIKEKNGDMKKVRDRLGDLREAEVQEILFQPFLRKLKNKRDGNIEITEWFKPLEI